MQLQSNLLRLPAEIRENIWKLSLSDVRDRRNLVVCRHLYEHQPPCRQSHKATRGGPLQLRKCPSILLANKQCYNEAASLLYERQTLRFCNLDCYWAKTTKGAPWKKVKIQMLARRVQVHVKNRKQPLTQDAVLLDHVQPVATFPITTSISEATELDKFCFQQTAENGTTPKCSVQE